MKLKKITLSTKYSKALKVNFKHVVLFLRKVNQIEFYFMNKKYLVDIDNDKEEFEVTEKELKEIVLKNIKEDKKEKKKRGRKAKKEVIEVKEKRKRGRPRKVKQNQEYVSGWEELI